MSNPAQVLAQLRKKLTLKKAEVQELEALIPLLEKHAEDGDSPRPSRKEKASRKVPNTNGLKSALLDLTFKGPFTVDDAVKALRAKNRNFARRQVRDSISVLVKKGEGFRRVKQGLGGDQSVYERIATIPDDAHRRPRTDGL